MHDVLQQALFDMLRRITLSSFLRTVATTDSEATSIIRDCSHILEFSYVISSWAVLIKRSSHIALGRGDSERSDLRIIPPQEPA